VTDVVLEGRDAAVTVSPDRGGRLAQIEVGARRLLRGPEHAHLGWAFWGSYPLIPWCNRIPDGRFRFEGRDLAVPVNWADGSAIHGLGMDAPWRVASQGQAAVELTIEMAEGPYRVSGGQLLELTDDSLHQRLEVTNQGDDDVPVGLGIHPWFRAGAVRVPADLMWPGDGPIPDGPATPVSGDDDLRTLRVPPPMDRCYSGLTDTEVEVPGVRLSWAGPVTQVVVYSEEPGWVCVEPVTMANDGFRLRHQGVAGAGVIVLPPGETVGVSYRFEWV
jgi:aldose 1-epimerase